MRRARWDLNYFMDGGENISSPLESLIRDKEQKGAESSKLAHYDVYTLTEPAQAQPRHRAAAGARSYKSATLPSTF